MMKFHFLLLFFIFNVFFTFSQTDLEEKEKMLHVKLLALRAAKTDEQMDQLNADFKKSMENFLKLDGAFEYKFQLLKTVAVLDAPDKKVRIVNWNIEYTDLSYTYGAFVMHVNENKGKIIVTELVDAIDAYSPKPEGIIDAKNWYGCLYYKIVPFERNNKTEYLLLGWDGGTTGSNFKLLDVLTINGNSIKLGSPVFKGKKSTTKRVIFEYSDKSNMVVRFEEKYGRVVMDHLSPESPTLAGLYSYYVPDMSYDAYAYADGAWYLQEDVIATNPDESKETKYFYALNSKTGRVEKRKMKGDWIDPTDIKHQGDIKHVARTVESEQAAKQAEQQPVAKVKEKRVRKRDDPNNLSVTTGKMRVKRTKRLP